MVEQGYFQSGDLVYCFVDKARRGLHSRLHSAGHVIDMAVYALGFDWVPGKGYHFSDGPYIEYSKAGNLEDKEAVKISLELMANKLIKEEYKTKLLFMTKEQMKLVCRFVPDYLPADKPSRVVMYGNFGVPCGGTHVSNLRDINSVIIRKIRVEGPTVRVSYLVGS